MARRASQESLKRRIVLVRQEISQLEGELSRYNASITVKGDSHVVPSSKRVKV